MPSVCATSDEGSGDECRDQRDRAEVRRKCDPRDCIAQAALRCPAERGRRFQLAAATIDQIEAHVRTPRAAFVLEIHAVCRCASEPDRACAPPVAPSAGFAGRSLRRPGGIGCASRSPSRRMPRPGRFSGPGRRRSSPPRSRASRSMPGIAGCRSVADRDLVGGLVLVSCLDELLGRVGRIPKGAARPSSAPGTAPGSAPAGRGRTRHERCGHRWIRAGHVRNHQDKAVGILVDHRDHPVRPAFRQVAVGSTRGDPQRNPAQVLDQRETQHDRDCPELTELQGRDAFVRGQEPAQPVQVDSAIPMRNRLQCDVIDPRKPRSRTFPRRGSSRL